MIVAAGLLVLSATAKIEFYGDRKTVAALVMEADGQIWAATRGGLIRFDRSGKPKTFGFDGLINGRGVDDLWTRNGKLFGSLGKAVARWTGSDWAIEPRENPRQALPVSRGPKEWVVPERPIWPTVISPEFEPTAANRGTHVTAVAGDERRLTAAWYGDGLWESSGAGWTRILGPNPFAEVRALTRVGADIALSTYAGDIWTRHSNKWKKLSTPNLPPGSFYSLAEFQGKLAAGAFEDGLSWFGKSRWTVDGGSGQLVRELVQFRGALYARQSTGDVARFDGRRWTKNVFPWLLRGPATCIAASDGKLWVGQFGGWSSFDGTRWKHFMKVPELQGLVVTALAATATEVLVGTQEKGLIRYSTRSGKVQAFDQRNGLGDDWVRRIYLDRRGVFVGMFRRGAFRLVEDRFEAITPMLATEATGFAQIPGTGRLLVGSREGLWLVDGKKARRIAVGGVESVEVQAVLGSRRGVWLGLPNGVMFLPWSAVR